MGRRKLRNCSKCAVRHGPPIGNLCERESVEFEEKNTEMGGADEARESDDSGANAEKAKPERGPSREEVIPQAPTYQPLGDEDYVPLFQAKPAARKKFNFKKTWASEEADLQAQARPKKGSLGSETGGGEKHTLQSQAASSGAGNRHQDYYPSTGAPGGWVQRSEPPTAGSFMPSERLFPHRQQPAWSGFPDDETERRLRRMEGMIERLSDIQKVQVRQDYFRMQEAKEDRDTIPRSTSATADARSQAVESSSSDSESEVGEWTEQDGHDLWKSTKEKKKRNPFEHSSYVRKGESVSSYEKLMVVTFKTLEQLVELNKDVKGLIRHGLAMSEKASAGVYKVNAFIQYDESVRERAGRHGPSTFGQVDQEDIMRFFCYDNVDKQKQAKSTGTVSKKKADRVCLRYNSEAGCLFKNCSFAHKCIACEEVGHARKDCRVLKKKDTK